MRFALLHDAEPEMGHAGGLDHARALPRDVLRTSVIEEADTRPEQDGYQP